MATNLDLISKLRKETGVSIGAIKKVLDEAKGDEKKAMLLLRRDGAKFAERKKDREVKEGAIGVYLHSNKKVASMVELLCETDFVAKNEEFQNLAKDLAMHIVAMNPLYLSPNDIQEEVVSREKEAILETLREDKKPEAIKQKIIEGKLQKFKEEICLLTQPFVKDPNISIEELLKEKIAKLGENIKVGRFVRLSLQ